MTKENGANNRTVESPIHEIKPDSIFHHRIRFKWSNYNWTGTWIQTGIQDSSQNPVWNWEPTTDFPFDTEPDSKMDKDSGS